MEKLVFFTQTEIIYFKQTFPLDIVEPEKKKKKKKNHIRIIIPAAASHGYSSSF